jgi:hypothetical protein
VKRRELVFVRLVVDSVVAKVEKDSSLQFLEAISFAEEKKKVTKKYQQKKKSTVGGELTSQKLPV